MKEVRFLKTFTCEVPVFVDGVATDEKRVAVKALFVSTTKGLSGLKTQNIYGSMFLDDDITEEEANKALAVDVDYSAELEFLPIKDSSFYKVVLK